MILRPVEGALEHVAVNGMKFFASVYGKFTVACCVAVRIGDIDVSIELSE